ncbi:uncharacterized protein J4E84_003666 [Alternaria hordeiaustralica]|uniref:uncharacterized protein n=1 Tax=Alternaria hordeiaustralica TaxID=1187925 RepID=UPI0020C32D81|nr:uncharacterized protein J4E84_003666 [Alternaria hordeiaustralica]KAI4691373.1 hypothetical protein J4E84_003666 [Alternaria hordeiaustralica]
MAATPIVVEGKNEENMNMDLGTGGTRSQQSDTSKNETPEGAPPMPSSRSLDSLMGTQGVLPSQSEQLSTLAVPTPTDGQGSTRQAFAAPSLSMNATSTFSLNFVASTIRPTLTVQADAIAMNEAMTIQPASTAVLGLLADSFAQDEIAALPGVNQDDPSLGTVPGRNQVTPLATPESSTVPSATSAMTVGKPMPGKNQPKPTMDVSAVSFMILSDSRSTAMSTISSSSTVSIATESSASSFSQPPTLVISTSSLTVSSTTTKPSSLPPVLTFVTVTRTAEAKEDIQPSTQTIMAPQAVTTRQSVSSGLRTLSLASGSVIPSSLATAVSVEPQHGLTPLARTLFILFGVLGEYRTRVLHDESNVNTGFVTILLAIGVTLIMRSNRRRAQAARQQAAGSPIKDIEEYDGYGNTTRVSANSSIKNVLTEPEKAIVNRAATPDGEPDVSTLQPQTQHNDANGVLQASTKPSNALTEAINSFITKSRRLTYKISP